MRTSTTLHVALASTLFTATAASTSARADDPPKLKGQGTQYVITPTPPPEKDAFEWRLVLGSTFSLSDNRSVLGQTDGTTVTFGYKLDGAADYNEEGHEWRNTLGVSAAMTNSPAVDELVKSRDTFTFETIYLYHAVDWFGPFARAALDSAVFSGYDVRPAPVSYLITRLGGETEGRLDRKLLLTDPWQPLALKQSLGVFFQPVAEEEVKLELRTALGARETLAKGALAVSDDDATPVVEVKELDNANQLGLEATAQISGATLDNRLLYKAAAEMLVPFLYSELPPDDDRGIGELISVALDGSLGVRVVEWASVDYELKVVRTPLILDAWQVQNNVLLTFGFTAPPPKPPPPPECK